MRRIRRWLRRSFGVVTPTGYGVALLTVAAWTVARFAGLDEFWLVAALGVVLLVIALPFVLAPTRARARIVLRPTHTVAGETGRALLTLTNRSPYPLLHPEIRLPIGERETRLRLPVLRPGVELVQDVAVPTFRRGVIDVGPVTVRRTDPCGLLRRHARWGRPVELYVRPLMIPLEGMTSGFLRELEGIPSDRISMNDLAFHALREYVRGDDLRHVHWRSSARAGQLLVRQYHQTRRNHATVLVDDDLDSYRSEEDFELAMSIAASLVVRAGLDETDLTFACADEFVTARSTADILDACCRVVPRARDLTAVAERAASEAPDTTLLLVTGGRSDYPRLASAQRVFPVGSRTLIFQAHSSGRSALGDSGGFPRLLCSRLDDLPQLLTGLVESGR